MKPRDFISQNSLREYSEYVCRYCGHDLNECTCESVPWDTDRRERDMREILNALGQRSYPVVEASSGNFFGSHRVQLEFQCLMCEFNNNQILPEGFALEERGQESIILRASIPYMLSYEEFEARRRELLDGLLEWAKTAPEQDWWY